MAAFLLLIASLAAGSALTAAGDGSLQGSDLVDEAIIPPENAEEIALKACPGVVTARELAREAGGSGLRYSFDIDSQGVTYEVGVDASNGRILQNAPSDGPTGE